MEIEFEPPVFGDDTPQWIQDMLNDDYNQWKIAIQYADREDWLHDILGNVEELEEKDDMGFVLGSKRDSRTRATGGKVATAQKTGIKGSTATTDTTPTSVLENPTTDWLGAHINTLNNTTANKLTDNNKSTSTKLINWLNTPTNELNSE